MKFSRAWAMPDSETFAIKPIADFIARYPGAVSIDPFSRNRLSATHCNDLNPATAAPSHMDAEDFLKIVAAQGVKADVVLFDPPYSPTQMARVYQRVGLKRDGSGTRNSELYSRVREAIPAVLAPGGTVLSFGWSSAGMGKEARLRDSRGAPGLPRRST